MIDDGLRRSSAALNRHRLAETNEPHAGQDGIRYRGARSGLAGLTVALALAAAAGAGLVMLTYADGHDENIAGAWRRAVDADPHFVQAFDRGTGQAALHPASSADTGKPLVVGERVTLVTPDGSIHTLRVCDPASAGAASASDCLNSLVARAIVPAAAPAPQRSL